MDDIVTLSDSELRKELLAHGVNVGPVTPTTRGVYQKKLSKIFLFSNYKYSLFT